MPLTENGLVTRRFDEILTDLISDEQSNIDPNIDARDDELLGQINKIWALKALEFEAVAQAAIDNMDVTLAEGVWLDKLASEKGLSRKSATKSYTNFQHLVGTDGTVVPSGTVFQNLINTDRYEVTDSTEISSSACRSVSISVSTVSNSSNYTITVNATPYVYSSDVDATELEILNGLDALITADTNKTWAQTLDTDELTLTITTSTLDDIAVSNSANLVINSVTTYTSIEAQEVGLKEAVSNTITNIVSAVGGLISTTNTLDIVPGRDREEDIDFRARVTTSKQIGSVATVEAIRSGVLNVDAVSTVSVAENTTGVIDGAGRPPHSFEVIADGGDDDEIAEVIWQTKSAGIYPHGTTSVIVTDIQGKQQTVRFTRPVATNLAFQITYTQNPEETLPADPDTLIQNIVVEETNILGIDEDVIPSRYFGPIYTGVEGLESLTVEVQEITNPGDTPNPGNWQTTKLSISDTEYASTTTADITVVAM